MSPYNFYLTPPGYNETDGCSSTPTQFSPFREEHANSGERSIAAGDQEINLYDWITPPYLSPNRATVDVVGRAAETFVPTITAQPPTPGSCLPLQDWSVQTCPRCGTGGYFPSSQRAVQVTPAQLHDSVTPDRAGSSAHGYCLPPTCDNQTGEMQGFPSYGGVFPLYPVVIGSLPLDDDTRAVAAHGTCSPVNAAPLVSDLPFGMGSEEPARAGLLQSGTNSNPKDSKKRKYEATTQDEPRKVKRIKYSMPQVPNLQRGSVQPTPLTLPNRPDLRLVHQIEYKSGSPQGKLQQLPDINFRVKGKEGINLMDAMNERFDGPDGRDDLMFTDGNVKGTVACRIIFEGYQKPGKVRQIVTTNHRREKSRITRKRLAQDIAKRVQGYLEELEAAGTPYPVRIEDMFVTKLTHVARSSWQPQIWCRVTPSSSTST